MSDGVCSRRCKYSGMVTDDKESIVIPPPPSGRVEWTAWFRDCWGKLRRFYGRES